MIYNPDIIFSPHDFIQTATGNIISRKSTINETRALEIPSGRCFIGAETTIKSDKAPIQINKYTYISQGVTLSPASTLKEPIQNIKMTIGSHTFVDEGCTIEAAKIGNGCIIGKNCILSQRCILKDYVRVLDGSVVLPDTVLPPFSIVAGNPAKIIGEQPESTSTLGPLEAIDRYKALKPSSFVK